MPRGIINREWPFVDKGGRSLAWVSREAESMGSNQGADLFCPPPVRDSLTWEGIVLIWVAPLARFLLKLAPYQKTRNMSSFLVGEHHRRFGRLPEFQHGWHPWFPSSKCQEAPTSPCYSQKCHRTFPDTSGCWQTPRAWWTCLLRNQGKTGNFLFCPFYFLPAYLSIYTSISFFFGFLFLFLFFITVWALTDILKQESLLKKTNSYLKERLKKDRRKEEGRVVGGEAGGNVSATFVGGPFWFFSLKPMRFPVRRLSYSCIICCNWPQRYEQMDSTENVVRMGEGF